MAGEGQTWYILVVESKENPRNIDDNIGPRLVGYIEDLVEMPASAIRPDGGNVFSRNDQGVRLDIGWFKLVSCVAVMVAGEDTVGKMAAEIEVDLVIGINPSPDVTRIWMKPRSEAGEEVAVILMGRTAEANLRAELILLH